MKPIAAILLCIAIGFFAGQCSADDVETLRQQLREAEQRIERLQIDLEYATNGRCPVEPPKQETKKPAKVGVA